MTRTEAQTRSELIDSQRGVFSPAQINEILQLTERLAA
jgi:hypothetical protein